MQRLPHVWLLVHNFGYGTSTWAYTTRARAQAEARLVREAHKAINTKPIDLYVLKVRVES